MIFRSIAITLLLSFLYMPAFGQSKTRPFSGSGLLLIQPLSTGQEQDVQSLAIYREPGVERIADIDPGKLPQLAPVMEGHSGAYPVAVIGKKGDWLKISYDDAGREGWLEMSRFWNYSPWASCLKGHVARILPGLKKEYYILYRDPSVNAPQLNTISRQKSLRIIEIREDWALVLVDSTAYGWLRWRDNDGRFAISIDDRFDPQKH